MKYYPRTPLLTKCEEGRKPSAVWKFCTAVPVIVREGGGGGGRLTPPFQFSLWCKKCRTALYWLPKKRDPEQGERSFFLSCSRRKVQRVCGSRVRNDYFFRL